MKREPLQPKRRKLGTIDLAASPADKHEGQASAEKSPSMASLRSIDLADQPASHLALSDRIQRNRHPLSSVALSALVHTLLLVVMTCIVYVWPNDQPPVSIVAEFNVSLEPDQPTVQRESININSPEENQSPVDLQFSDVADADQPLTPEDSHTEQFAVSDQSVPMEDMQPDQAVNVLATGGGLGGRDLEARAALAAQRGGTPASEQAVERGLKWLIAHQQDDGSWRFDFRGPPCDSRCANHGTRESTTAATGLALMALLGAGYTHQVGPYQSEIKNGLDYLIERMRKSYYGGNLAEGSMYAQAIATIALGEAFAMTGDPRLKEPVYLAMQYIVTAQHPKGGWRYQPGEPGDMTVTGWQLMALKSCELTGLDAPRSTWRSAEEFIDSLATSGGSYYGYLKPEDQPTTTAIGLLMRMYLGWQREKGALKIGADFLAERGPSETNVYFNYYATQVLHHLQSEDWPEWNRTLRDYLVRTQSQIGHESGSWHFRDKHGDVGGRLYTTAMAIMTLEVYYRYLPLYDDAAIK